MELLPANFDELVQEAIKTFWVNRSAGAGCQDGNRGSVIGGKNLDGFLLLVKAIVEHCGLPRSSVYTDGRSGLTLPGYYRPTKNWDALVVHRCRLIAAMEFKSQVGPSFGNNYNNRTEEAIGSAADLWEAHLAGAYEPSNFCAPAPTVVPSALDDPRPPFRGWVMLLEECERSTRAISGASTHYKVFPEFAGASYADRYRIFCERLLAKGLYSGAALILSTREQGAARGHGRSLSPSTDIRTFFAEFAGRIAAAAETDRRCGTR